MEKGKAFAFAYAVFRPHILFLVEVRQGELYMGRFCNVDFVGTWAFVVFAYAVLVFPFHLAD